MTIIIVVEVLTASRAVRATATAGVAAAAEAGTATDAAAAARWQQQLNAAAGAAAINTTTAAAAADDSSHSAAASLTAVTGNAAAGKHTAAELYQFLYFLIQLTLLYFFIRNNRALSLSLWWRGVNARLKYSQIAFFASVAPSLALFPLILYIFYTLIAAGTG